MLTLSFCEPCCTFKRSFLQEITVERPGVSQKQRSFRVKLLALLAMILTMGCFNAVHDNNFAFAIMRKDLT